MKFTINSKILKGALELLSPAYNPRAVVPVVLYAKVEVLDGCVDISMTDLQTTMKHRVDCATSGSGVFLLPFKEIKSISGTIDATATIEWSAKDGVIVRFESDVFKLGKSDKPDAFPLFPKVKREAGVAVGKDFFIAIGSAARSAANDTVLKYKHSHVCVELNKDNITITATDDNTLYTKKIAGKIDVAERVELLLPRGVVSALGGFDSAEIYYDNKRILFVSEHLEVCMLLGDGEYLPWRQIMPNHITNLSLDVLDLEFAINKSFAIGGKEVYSIVLSPKENELHLKTLDKNTGVGCSSIIPCKSSVPFDDICFNRGFLLNAIKQLSETGGRDMEISMTHPERASLFKMSGFDDATTLVMPMSL